MEPLRRTGPHVWLTLAVAAAAVAGVLALLITAARLPLLAGALPRESFYKLLVGHVTFSLEVWLLSCSVALVLHRSNVPSLPLAPALAALGAAGMLAGLALPGRPVMVDYFPYVDSPFYVGGYILFGIGVALALWPCLRSQAPWGPRSAAIAYGATLTAVAVGLARAGPASPQAALWAGGHALQFVYVIALALAWYELAGLGGSDRPLARQAFTLAAGLSWTPLWLYLAPQVEEIPRWAAANAAMGFALSLPTLLHLRVLAPRILRVPGLEGAALRWSVGLYLLGGLLAPLGAGNTLQVTAHYHAMLVGGVTTAFMGGVLRILGQHGVPVQREAGRLQVHLFGLGVVLTVAALLVAAGHGLPRKAYLAGGHPWSVPMLLMTAAAGFAAVGGAWFLGCAGTSLRYLYRNGRTGPPAKRWGVRKASPWGL